MAGRGYEHSHSNLERAKPCGMDVSPEKRLELEGSWKRWPLRFLVEGSPPYKQFSVGNRSESTEDRCEADYLVCEGKNTPNLQARVCGKT